jgi:hypothetical protein
MFLPGFVSMLILRNRFTTNIQSPQIDQLQRPLAASFWVEHKDRPVVNALLWSDPTGDESRTGYEPSDRGGDLKLFGSNVVDDFCQVREGAAELDRELCFF